MTDENRNDIDEDVEQILVDVGASMIGAELERAASDMLQSGDYSSARERVETVAEKLRLFDPYRKEITELREED